MRCYNVFKPQNSDEAYLVLQAVVPEKERTTSSLLAWLIPGKPLPVFQALLFALQIARGMRYVVNQLPGFVYGDLKPESVLVGAGRLSQVNVNRLRVTDFGLAGVLRADAIDPIKFRQTGAVPIGRTQLINGGVGTPLYMSLEQWYGESAGTATDVYALGCLLYKMLVGRHLVGGETLQALQADHCTGNLWPLPGTLPKVVRDMTTRCLALEPKARYQSWEEVETAIAAAYESAIKQPVPAAEPTDAPTASERVWTGWFLHSLGQASYESGNMTTAINCLELARNTGDTEGDKALAGAATNDLGGVILKLGDTQRAIEHSETALRSRARPASERPRARR